MSNGNGLGKGLRIGWTILIILLSVAAYAGSYSVLRATVGNHEKRIERNESVIERIDKSLIGIQKDIEYIKDNLK